MKEKQKKNTKNKFHDAAKKTHHFNQFIQHSRFDFPPDENPPD